MVIDMRGYPGINHYELAQRLIPFQFQSPQFHVQLWDGPFGSSVDFSQYDIAPLMDLSFNGPMVLMVGHNTVSAAENFSTMLVDAGVVTVVGRDSAATNGNITGVQLPSGFEMSFTGMEVLHADGADFHGIGIVPDVPVVLSAADFRDGIDPELEAAIAVLP
jgi:C-terminal processing protease CtpA/Prc